MNDMDKLADFLNLLGSAVGPVSVLVAYSLAGLVMTWLCGTWLLLLLAPGRPATAISDPRGEWLWLHPVVLAAGWGTLISVSTASLYLTKGMLAGEVLLVLLAVSSGVLLLRFRPRFDWNGYGTLVLIGLAALVIGIWQHVGTALPVTDGSDYLVFSDLHLDLPIHVALAGVIQDSGLPLVNLWPSDTHAYSAPMHIGHAIAIASYSSAMGISLYEASTVSFVVATVLTAWCALGLFAARVKPQAGYALLVMLSTLAIGQLTLPWLHDPTAPRAPLDTGIWLASRSYWNISQAISIALTIGGLLVLDGYCAVRREGRVQLPVLGVAVGLIAIGGLVKPSLVIFFGPALFFWLVLSGARIAEFMVTVVVLQVAFMTYMLPRFLHVSVGGPGWSVGPEEGQFAEVALFLWHACFGIAVILCGVVIRSVGSGWRTRRWQVLDLGVIALGGSILFALLFREVRFVGFPVLQPNIWWGISGCIVLLVPLASREIPGLLSSGKRLRWLAVLGLGVLAVQTLNGLRVAWVYPFMNLRRHDAVLAETLDRARELTVPGTRFALDPTLEHFDLRPFLSRPSLMLTSYTLPRNRQAYSSWKAFVASGRARPPLERLDAVVLDQQRGNAHRFFAEQGWRAVTINDRYTLWHREGVGRLLSDGGKLQ